jgi:integrase
MQLTKNAVAALTRPTGKTDHIEWDDALPGFGVRLRGKSKRWIVQYRVGTQQRRESLGDVRKINLDDARKIAKQRFAQVELGTDPAAERAKARRLTLASVVSRYLAAKQSSVRPSTFNNAKRYLIVLWKPLADRPIDSIGRADVAARLQDIIAAHGRMSAARARANLSAMFSWAMKEGLCDSNPVVATNDPADGSKPRERVLSDHELGVVWNACLDDDFGRIIKLLVLTGCRREEIGALKWHEIDLDAGVMTIPGTRTKNHRTLTLTLPQIAIDILRSAPRRPGRDYVFGTRGGVYSGYSYSTISLHSRIAAAEGRPLPHFVIHDLRRTMRSGLGRLGIPPHVAELAINHAREGIEAIYDRHTYAGEITTALARWADHVLAVVEGRPSKIVPLRA